MKWTALKLQYCVNWIEITVLFQLERRHDFSSERIKVREEQTAKKNITGKVNTDQVAPSSGGGVGRD